MNTSVVRVILFKGIDSVGEGLLVWLKTFHQGALIRIHEEDEKKICFDMLPPVNASETWAKSNAHWISQRGINAVVAPGYGEP